MSARTLAVRRPRVSRQISANLGGGLQNQSPELILTGLQQLTPRPQAPPSWEKLMLAHPPPGPYVLKHCHSSHLHNYRPHCLQTKADTQAGLAGPHL